VVGQATVTAGSSQALQTVTPVAGTLLQAAVDKASAQISQTLSYTLTTDYLGGALLHSAVVTAAVPAGTSYVAGSANAGGVESGGVVTWTLGSNAAGAVGCGAGSGGGGGASIALDNTTNTSGQNNPITFAHATGTGSNRLLLVGFIMNDPKTVTSVTYNGVALTQAGSSANGSNVEA
jgi:uncharacterized repeat protein (TIGR01451 family)